MSNPFDQFDAAPTASAPGPDVESMVRASAQQQGVDPDFAVSIARQESGLRHDPRPNAKGSIGVMQLQPGTAADMGVDPTDLGQNIDGGVRYLGHQLQSFGGDRRLAAAAYNAGPGNVRKYGGVPPFQETQNYVAAVAPDDGAGQAAQANPFDQFDGGDQTAPGSTQDPSHYTGKGISVEVGGPDPTGPGWTHQPTNLSPNAPAAPSVSADMAKALPAGAARAGTSIVDSVLQASPIGMIPQMLRTAADLGSGAAPTTKPFNGMSQAVDQHLYTPQTTPGRYAEAIGEMLPNAVTPGGLARKAASVALPAIGAQAAGDLAGYLGANPTTQAVARFLGGAGGGLATGLGIRPAQVGEAPQTLEQLKAARTAAYQAAENSGATVKPADAKALVSTIDDLVQSKGGASLYPTAARMVTRLKTLVKGGITPTQLDDYRSQVYDQLVSDGGKESVIGKAIRGHIDSVLDSDPSWQNARDINTRYMKVKEVSDRLDSAGLRAASTYSGGNFANAVRQKIRPLVDPKSAQQIRNLTPAEQAAARMVVQGTPLQNVTRKLGKVLNNKFVQTGLMLATPHGVGFPLAEAAGAGIRKASDAQTEAAVQKLIDMMSTGGQAQQGAGLRYQLAPTEPFNLGTVLGAARSTPYPAQAPAR